MDKTVLTDAGPFALEIPRDRHGPFAPVLIPKHERRFIGFDDKIIALYARGLTLREIQAFLAEMYAVEVSADLISTVTDTVVAEVTAWQTRPLAPLYTVVFLDALRVKTRDEGTVRSKAVYLALGMLPTSTREILGVWIEQSDRVTCRPSIGSAHKNRTPPGCLAAALPHVAGRRPAVPGSTSLWCFCCVSAVCLLCVCCVFCCVSAVCLLCSSVFFCVLLCSSVVLGSSSEVP